MTSNLSLLLNNEANAYRGYMDHMNTCAYYKERFQLESKVYSLILCIFYGAIASISKIGGFFWSCHPFNQWRHDQLQAQIRDDKALLSLEKVQEIHQQYFAQDEQVAEFDQSLALATYGTTYNHYGPVVFEWALSLLQRAQENGEQLVFMARDGQGPYLAAQALQRRLPLLNTVPIHYIYLSRKVVHGDKALLEQYLAQELASHPYRNFRFVDIGFFGSIVDRIRCCMQEAIQGSRCEFEFLISTSSRAHGFAGSLENELHAIRSAGKNRAVYWLEDTHQGIVQSPKQLIANQGTVTPDTVAGEKLVQTNRADRLCREIAIKAIEDYATEVSQTELEASAKGPPQNTLSSTKKANFNRWLNEIRLNRFLYIAHC